MLKHIRCTLLARSLHMPCTCTVGSKPVGGKSVGTATMRQPLPCKAFSATHVQTLVQSNVQAFTAQKPSNPITCNPYNCSLLLQRERVIEPTEQQIIDQSQPEYASARNSITSRETSR